MMLGLDANAWPLILESLAAHRCSLQDRDDSSRKKREEIDELLSSLRGIGGKSATGRIDGYHIPAVLYGHNVMLELRISSESQMPDDEPVLPDEPIENLKLSRRALTCLHKAGITTISQLTGKAYRDLWQMNNCGHLTVRDIERALTARGLVLKGEYLDLGDWHPKQAPRRKPPQMET